MGKTPTYETKSVRDKRIGAGRSIAKTAASEAARPKGPMGRGKTKP